MADASLKKEIVFLPAGGGMDLRTTNVNSLLSAYGISALAQQPTQ